MLSLGLVFVHLQRRAGGARPKTEMDFDWLQTASGSGSPTGCAVAADCTPGEQWRKNQFYRFYRIKHFYIV